MSSIFLSTGSGPCIHYRFAPKSYGYDVKGRYLHNWRHTNGIEEVNVLQSDRVTRYKMPTSGHVLVFGGSSQIRKNHEEKKRLAQLEKVGANESLLGDGANRFLPSSQGLLFPVDSGKPDGPNARNVPQRKKVHVYTKRVAARLRNYAQCFARAGARAFITLTFLDSVTDQQAMKCFSAYMQNWRVSGKKPHYIAVMEYQPGGRPHFHILVREYINIPVENTRWVNVQYNQGIMMVRKDGTGPDDYYTREEIIEAARCNRLTDAECELWGYKKMKHLANPLDVKKIHDAVGASYYITKYITKSVKEGIEYGCKPWSCSRSVSKMYKTALVVPEIFDAALTNVNTAIRAKDWISKENGEVIKKAGSVIEPVIIQNDYASTVSIVNKKYFTELLSDMDAINKKWFDTGYLEPEKRITFTEYYNNFCRDYNVDEVALSKQEYENIFDVGGTDFNKLMLSDADSDYFKNKIQFHNGRKNFTGSSPGS